MSRRRNKIRSASAWFNAFNGKRNPAKKKTAGAGTPTAEEHRYIYKMSISPEKDIDK